MGWFPCCCGQCEYCLTYYTDFTSGFASGVKPPGSDYPLPTGWNYDLNNIESVGIIEVFDGGVVFTSQDDYAVWITNAGDSGLNSIPTGSTGNVYIESEFYIWPEYGQWFGYRMYYEGGKSRLYQFSDNGLIVWKDDGSHLEMVSSQTTVLPNFNLVGANLKVSFCFDSTYDEGRGETQVILRKPNDPTTVYLFHRDPWVISGNEGLNVSGGYLGADIGAFGSGYYLPPIPPSTTGTTVYENEHATLYSYGIWDTDDVNCCPCSGFASGYDIVAECAWCTDGPSVITPSGYMNFQISGLWVERFNNSCPACCADLPTEFFDIPFIGGGKNVPLEGGFYPGLANERSLCRWRKEYFYDPPLKYNAYTPGRGIDYCAIEVNLYSHFLNPNDQVLQTNIVFGEGPWKVGEVMFWSSGDQTGAFVGPISAYLTNGFGICSGELSGELMYSFGESFYNCAINNHGSFNRTGILTYSDTTGFMGI